MRVSIERTKLADQRVLTIDVDTCQGHMSHDLRIRVLLCRCDDSDNFSDAYFVRIILQFFRTVPTQSMDVFPLISEMLLIRTLPSGVKVMHPIRVSHDDCTLTKLSNQLCRLI